MIDEEPLNNAGVGSLLSNCWNELFLLLMLGISGMSFSNFSSKSILLKSGSGTFTNWKLDCRFFRRFRLSACICAAFPFPKSLLFDLFENQLRDFPNVTFGLLGIDLVIFGPGNNASILISFGLLSSSMKLYKWASWF